MVFQDPDDQLFMPTVEEDVAFGPLHLGLAQGQVKQRVDHALETTGIGHLRRRPPYRLSGGEKRAASIATVLSIWPDILVLDEPSAFLDPRSRGRLIDLLNTFHHTKIIATHDLDLALRLCGRAIVLSEKTVCGDDTIHAVLRDTTLLRNAGLEPPSTGSCPVCGRSGQVV